MPHPKSAPSALSPIDPHVPDTLRHAFASFATGVTVITALDEHGAPVGMTANSFGSVSLDPPLVQWSLRVNSGLHRIFVETTHFSVSVLAAHQTHIARQFASRAPDRFVDIALLETKDEPPLIRGALAHFVCKKITVHRIGDHELFVGEVLRASANEGAPLLFHGSKFIATR